MSAIPVKISLNPVGHNCTVMLDGKDVTKHLVEMVVTARVGKATTLSLSFINLQVEVEGEVGEVKESTEPVPVEYVNGRALQDTTDLGSTWRERSL